MKGLIYRELVISKKTKLTGAFAVLSVLVLFIMICVSAQVGNIAKQDNCEFIESMAFYVTLYVPAIMLMLVLSVDNSVVLSDVNTRWNSYSRALPVSAEKTIGAKFIINAVAIVSVYALSILIALITCGICDRSFSAKIIRNLAIIALVVWVISAVCHAMYIALGKKGVAVLAVLGIAAYIGLEFWAFSRLDEATSVFGEDADDMVVWSYIISKTLDKLPKLNVSFAVSAIAVAAVISVVSFFTAVNIIKRREL